MTQEPVDAARPSEPAWLGKLQMVLVFLALLVHPTDYAINLGQAAADRHVLASLGLMGANVFVTLADLFLLAGLGVYVARYFIRREWRNLPRVSLPAALLLGWFLLSAVPFLKGAFGEQATINRMSFAKNFAQLFEYLIIAYFLFREGFDCPVFRRWAPVILMAQATAAVGWAWSHYLSPDVGALLVSGPLATRNSFGATMAMMLPFALGVGLFSGRILLLLWAVVLVLAALPVTLAAGPLAAVCLAALVLLWLRRPAAFVAGGVVLILALCVALPAISRDRDTFPWARDNVGVLTDSLLLHRRGDPHRVLKWTRNQPPDTGAESFLGKGEGWAWRQKFKEWQVAVLMVSRSPLFGVGGGSFVDNIGGAGYYNNPFVEWSMPKADEDLMEEGAQNFYLMLAATAGLPALFFVLWLLLQHASAGAALIGPRGPAAGVGAGVVGALAGFAVAAIFAEPMVRGTGLTFIAILALARSFPREEETGGGESEAMPPPEATGVAAKAPPEEEPEAPEEPIAPRLEEPETLEEEPEAPDDPFGPRVEEPETPEEPFPSQPEEEPEATEDPFAPRLEEPETPEEPLPPQPEETEAGEEPPAPPEEEPETPEETFGLRREEPESDQEPSFSFEEEDRDDEDEEEEEDEEGETRQA